MADTSLSAALAGLTADDISVDEEGRVSVENPEVARRISEVVTGTARATPTNSGCNSGCRPNGSRCRPT
ncbi:hypothetical protein [Streptomyces capillispiralis]|uniref:hypothetical protein n=1 Tax=Streptomyces capillispiralis TaxID=68182 RepID=UPI0011A3D5A8|nr:hypothetical protein [Streptomyces capillispiralis]